MRHPPLPCRILLVLGLVTAPVAAPPAQTHPSGTLEISQAQIGSVPGQTVGGGTLRFRGSSYPFNLAGLGVRGPEAPAIRARGEVYNLEDVSAFSGIYREGPKSPSPTATDDATLTLTNEQGVTLRLRSRQPEAVLRLGPDGVRITLNLH